MTAPTDPWSDPWTDAWTCDLCGSSEQDAGARLTWSSAVERGRLHRFCGGCSRTNARAMEGRLDTEHW